MCVPRDGPAISPPASKQDSALDTQWERRRKRNSEWCCVLTWRQDTRKKEASLRKGNPEEQHIQEAALKAPQCLRAVTSLKVSHIPSWWLQTCVSCSQLCLGTAQERTAWGFAIPESPAFLPSLVGREEGRKRRKEGGREVRREDYSCSFRAARTILRGNNHSEY